MRNFISAPVPRHIFESRLNQQCAGTLCSCFPRPPPLPSYIPDVLARAMSISSSLGANDSEANLSIIINNNNRYGVWRGCLRTLRRGKTTKQNETETKRNETKSTEDPLVSFIRSTILYTHANECNHAIIFWVDECTDTFQEELGRQPPP